MKNYKQTATDVLRLIGGEKNVSHLEHCSTRLRFSVVNSGKVDKDALKALKGVMGVISSGNQCQVVIGNDVIEVYDEIMKLGSFNGGTNSDAPKEKKKVGAVILDFVVGVFQPLVPVMAGAGMIKAFLSLFVMLHWMSNTSIPYRVMMEVADAALYFLPVLVAYTMASKINCNKLVAATIAGALILPATGTMLGEGVSLFGISLQSVSYAYQVFPAILAVAVLYFVEKGITKISPKPIRVFFVPMVCFIVVFPLTLMFLGPLGLTIGKGLTAVILFLYDKLGWIAVALLGAILPFMIATGMHKALVPYAVGSLTEMGKEILYLPASLAHNISECGACFGVAVRTKNEDTRAAAISGGVSALFGITEPALYSVTLQNKTALKGVISGGFIGGLVIGLFGVKAFAPVGPGLASMTMYVDPENAKNLGYAFVGFAVSLVVSFVVTMILYREDNNTASNKKTDEKADEKVSANAVSSELVSPMTGKAVPLSEVKDETFAQEILGPGMAVIPENGELYAPADGTIAMVFDTKHAVSMVSDDGAEILMHIGLDTVKLNGKGFDAKVKAGDKVQKGQLLLKFDMKEIQSAGYDVTTPIIITNSEEFAVTPVAEGNVVHGGILMKLEAK